MNRLSYFNYIVEKLSALATTIELRGKLNYLDLHLHSENFYQHFFNELFGWELQNLNQAEQNAEAIDLIDRKNKIVIQVSATATRQKVESSLAKDLSSYDGYTFKFISISRDAGALRSIAFAIPKNLYFNPQTDIYDVGSILKFISGLNIEKLKNIYEFIKEELESYKYEPKQNTKPNDNYVLFRQLEALLVENKKRVEREKSLFGSSDAKTIAEIARLEAEMERLR